MILRYLGKNQDSGLPMLPDEHKTKIQWQIFEDAEALLDDCQRTTLLHGLSCEGDAGLNGRNSLAKAYATVILDVPDASEAASILREVKSINRGIPVIVLSEQVTLNLFSLALLDGSDALFQKPLDCMEPFWEAIGRANRRVQRWVAALENAPVCQIS